MMIFTDVQLIIMESDAKRLLSDLIIALGLKEKEEWNIGKIMERFREMVSMGRSIALDEVCSTPWEYETQPIRTSRDVNDETMNGYAERGWELQFVSSGWMFWRRRKAVREIEKETPIR